MQTRASFGWKHALALLVIAAVASVAFASVFVYYPSYSFAYYQEPPVVWSAGTNTNETDLGNQKILVLTGPNATELNITVHPTYEYTYYKNITIIQNNDASNGYYIAIRIVTAANITNAASAAFVKMILYNDTSKEVIDLDSTGTTPWYYIPSGSHVNVDLEYYLPSGVTLPKVVTFQVYLIYSPTNSEAPPSLS